MKFLLSLLTTLIFVEIQAQEVEAKSDSSFFVSMTNYGTDGYDNPKLISTDFTKYIKNRPRFYLKKQTEIIFDYKRSLLLSGVNFNGVIQVYSDPFNYQIIAYTSNSLNGPWVKVLDSTVTTANQRYLSERL